MRIDHLAFSALKGKTLTEVIATDDQITFVAGDERYVMEHYQDCCESVSIEDICGDVNDLIGSEIVDAYDASNEGEAVPVGWTDDGYESYTWTFYRISTAKGAVTIRWFGSSNGYYSEGVDFMRTA